MDKLMDEVIGYEGLSIDDRGVVDTIKQIIVNISCQMPNNDRKTNEFLTNDYSMYSCIKDFVICGNCCYLKYFVIMRV